MMLSTLYWPDEVRDVGELDLPAEEPDFKPAELAMARQLVDALTGEFDPSQYHDEYREALLKVIDAKVAGQPVEAPEEERVETSKLTDLMAVLEASVAEARGRVRDADEEKEPVSVSEARRSRGGRTAAGSTRSAGAKATTAKKGSKATASGSKRAAEPAGRRRKTA
jgi:DNA end-binding protein Ku